MLISYLICSHRAPPVIDRALQSVVREIAGGDAELLLVNNGFADAREHELAAQYGFGGTGFRGRIIREPQLGLGFARLQGFREAQGSAVVLLDDDNELEPGFDEALRRVIGRHPRWGSICPVVVPQWEAPSVPDWLRALGPGCLSYTHAVAPAASATDEEWTAGECDQAQRSPGGGMIVHRAVVDAYLRSVTGTARASLARTGADLGGCEDADLFNHVWVAGRTAVRSSEPRLRHHISVGRCRLGYLVRLNFAMTRSYVQLDRLCRVPTARRVAQHGIKIPLRELTSGLRASLLHASPSPLIVHGARALGALRGLLG
jgi:glycosyltransferase involved in cell wall biosynthesis